MRTLPGEWAIPVNKDTAILMISGDKTVHFNDAFGVTAFILITES